MADRTAKDIIAELNGLEGEERKEALKLLQNDQGDVVRTARDKAAASGRRTGEATLAKVKEEATEIETLDDLFKLAQAVGVSEEKLEAMRKKVPDRATLENEIKGQFGTQLEKFKVRNTALEGENLELRRGKHTKKLAEKLAKNHHIDPEYAEEFLVTKHRDRIAPVKDKPGDFDFLQPDGKTPYEGESEDEKLDHMAADIAKTVHARYVLTGADRGSGLGGNGAGGVAGGVDKKELTTRALNSGLYTGRL